MGTAAGTGASVSYQGNDMAGKITFTTGSSGLTSGTILTVTYQTGMTGPTFPVITAANSAAAGQMTNFSAIADRQTSPYRLEPLWLLQPRT
jgi:hypothetical protein